MGEFPKRHPTIDLPKISLGTLSHSFPGTNNFKHLIAQVVCYSFRRLPLLYYNEQVFVFEEKLTFLSQDIWIFVFWCRIHKLQNLRHHHRHHYTLETNFGQILVQLMTNIFNSIFVLFSKIENFFEALFMILMIRLFLIGDV